MDSTNPENQAIASLSDLFASLWKGNTKEIVRKQEQNEEKPQPMLVIGAGYCRTSTSSLKTALEKLGIKSYHMKHAALDDMAWWYHHITHSPKVNETESYLELVQHMSKVGYNATVDHPNSFHFETLMKVYPEARVVLTVRPGTAGNGGQSWAKSVIASVDRLRDCTTRVPWRWLEKARHFEQLNHWTRHQELDRVPKESLTGDLVEDLGQAYDAWTTHVQNTVPPDRLLTFAATDGWEPLCSFSRPLQNSQIDKNCNEILASGESYPFMNDSAAFEVLIRSLEGISAFFEALPLLALVSFITVMWWRQQFWKISVPRVKQS